MKLRNFGKLDWKASALGFGAMRLPTIGDDPHTAKVDEAEAIRIIRRAIDGGVNYIDTAYVYHNGESEVVLGKALRDRYRQRTRVATKSPVWMIREEADFDRLLEEQLTRLQSKYIDFYLLHALGAKRWNENILPHNVLRRAEAAKLDGRIRHLGFSFHDDHRAFVEILNGYDGWEFCQIQYNYIDIENQAGIAGLKMAAKRGLAVVIMEPLLGGRLANPPASIRQIIDAGWPGRTAADLALQWVWNQPEVSLILSGMSTMAQVEENLKSADGSGIGILSNAQMALIDRLREAYRQRAPIPCTNCGYCMPCPTGLNIPRNFELFNDVHLHQNAATPRFLYKVFVPESERAGACAACRECEDLCPQKIPISEWMPRVNALLRGSEIAGSPET
ncbi:MAG TPA: aldo/keto reductase [Terriglobales bacterium]|nr:aldo/keto reductase [Terriglobales bacterium]